VSSKDLFISSKFSHVGHLLEPSQIQFSQVLFVRLFVRYPSNKTVQLLSFISTNSSNFKLLDFANACIPVPVTKSE